MTPETPTGKVILVVDDDDAYRYAVLHILRHAGYAAAGAPDGRAALEYLRGQPAPALILLDLLLPDLPGREFRRRQLADPALAAVPVVVLSGVAAGAAADALGDVGYLQKPVETEDLLAAVARFAAPRKPGVLVVEDEPAVLRMLEVALRHHGFVVRPAGGGAEAVRLYQTERGGIDVVLLDVQMAGGMDGPHTLDALHRLEPTVPVVFMSGNTGAYSGEDLVSRGAACVLPKPFASIAGLARTLWQLARPG